MKIRIFGFEPITSFLPTAIPPTAAFDWMVQNPGTPLNKVISVGAVETGDWYAGVIIKARDASSLIKMLQEGAIRVVRAEKIPEGEKVTETSFFVAHRKTGRGLYAHYHTAATLTGDFAWICGNAFNRKRLQVMDKELTQESLTAKIKSLIRKNHAGMLKIHQILNKATLKDFLKTVNRVSAFEASFTAFELEEDIFEPLSKIAKRKTVSLTFPADLALDRLESELEDAANSSLLENFSVSGYNAKKKLVEFNKLKNAQIFGEYDYNELLGGLEMRLDDWNTAICECEVVKKLLAIANGAGVRIMLERDENL